MQKEWSFSQGMRRSLVREGPKVSLRLALCALASVIAAKGAGLESPLGRTVPSSLKQAVLAKRAEALLAQMTPEEKIGQMVLFTAGETITGPSGQRQDLREQIRAGRCGTIFNAHTVATIRGYQKLAVENSRLRIPLLFGYDVIHGYKTIFPIPLGQAASWDTNAVERSARIAAIEASASGLNWTFAPMVDIARDPRWGRIAEGAGEDPFLGCAMARANVLGFQGNLSDVSALAACVKHYAAYGAAQAGRDYNTVDLSERTLREIYLPPFKAAVDAGALSLMTAFNELNGVPATANPFLLRQVLRDEWNFQGFTVTDYTSINELLNHGIAGTLYDAGRQALNAGVDMDMQGGVYFEYLKQMLSKGDITQNQIDAAAKRILICKLALGLVDDPYRYCDEQRETRLIYAPEHVEAAYDMACRSMVLLKNEGQILPLKPGKQLAVIGPLAEAKADLLGTWCGLGEGRRVTSVLESIRKANGAGKVLYAKGCDVASQDRSGLAAALKAARRADLVVLVAGESADMSGESASRTSINLPGVQTELLRELKKTGKPVVMVLLNGRPLALEEEAGLADALLEAWHPGTEGGRAIADVLFGKRNPSAKLPVTFPRTLGQVPLFYDAKNTGRPISPDNPREKYKSNYLDCPNDPLYPFGFGQSYTSFAYSDLQLDKTRLAPGERLTASIQLANTGPRDGTEIVQLYLRDLVASVTRPVLELRGFQKVELRVGEQRRVSFTVGEEDLAFLRRDMTWGTEPGQYRLFIGPNSRDFHSAGFELRGPRGS